MYCKNCGSKLEENRSCKKCEKFSSNHKEKTAKSKRFFLALFGILAVLIFFIGVFAMILTLVMINTNDAYFGIGFFPFLIIFFSWSYLLYREWKNEQKKIIKKEDNLVGIKGWLLIPFWGAILSMIYVSKNFSSGLLVSLLLLVFIVSLLGSFAKRQKITPLLYIIFLFINFLIASMNSNGMLIFQSFIILIIWSLYFVKSKRVRLTFINSLKAKI